MRCNLELFARYPQRWDLPAAEKRAPFVLLLKQRNKQKKHTKNQKRNLLCVTMQL